MADYEKTSMKVLSERGEEGGFRRSENSEKIGNARMNVQVNFFTSNTVEKNLKIS